MPVMFTVLEPATVLICACLPMTQSLFKRLAQLKMASYLSLFAFPSRGSRNSGNSNSQPVPDSEVKRGQWAKLGEDSLLSQAKSEGHVRTTLSDRNEEYELSTPTSAPKKEPGPSEVHGLV